jgi:hypothetical protein
MRAAARILPDQVFNSATVIVFGRDGKKARGSWFPAEAGAAAHSAAEAMGMNALDVANDDIRQLATKLPQGRVFDSGKAFVPFVQTAVLEALVSHLPDGELVKVRASGAASSPSSPAASKAPAVAPHYPRGWDDIKVGSLVLASESEEDGWWPCIVQEAYEKEVRLKWRDYPDYEVFTRGRDQLALLWAAPTASVSN